MVLGCVLLIIAGVDALRFSPVFGNGMVLQRATTALPHQQAAVYGDQAAPNTAVTVTVSSSDLLSPRRVVNATVNAQGTCKALLKPQLAGEGFTVTATQGTAEAKLSDIGFGDIWFCSGQSNVSCLIAPEPQLLILLCLDGIKHAFHFRAERYIRGSGQESIYKYPRVPSRPLSSAVCIACLDSGRKICAA